MKTKNSLQMTNSHILINGFDYYEAYSIDDATVLLEKYGEEARVLAGGTNLIVSMKMENIAPQVLINLNTIDALKHLWLDEKNGDLHIGALTPIRNLAKDPFIRDHFPALAEAASLFGSTMIQVMGTIGGNVCNGSPASDTVPSLMIYKAQLAISGPSGQRIMKLRDFLLGPGKTALQKGEIITEIILPANPDESVSLYLKISRVAADLAKASLALFLTRRGNTIDTCRIALGSVAPKVLCAEKTEAYLIGKEPTAEVLAEAGKIIMDEVSPIDDTRSTAWYRRQIVSVMVQDAVNAAWKKVDAVPSPQTRSPLPQTPGNKPHKPIVTREDIVEVNLRVNGILHRLHLPPNELLLNTLRERLDLNGAKYGCGVGECSACTVLIDGKPHLACLVLTLNAEGKEITTIEGLQKPNGKLHPLQESFIKETGFQCGYCTPGMVMTAKFLLDEIPNPTEEEIKDYLKGNRCRCTGYASIVRSVLACVN